MLRASVAISIVLFCYLVGFESANGAINKVDVRIVWDYKDFPLKVELYAVRKGSEAQVSQTKVVLNLEEAPIQGKPIDRLLLSPNSSKVGVLVVHNPSDQDVYFFAVPHMVNPAHASAGHYFECLCVGYVYKIPKKSNWYRIVRVNLDKSFYGVQNFEIKHEIIGVTATDANSKYKQKLYSQ